MPGFDWNTGSGEVSDPKVHSVKYQIAWCDVKADGSLGAEIETSPAANMHVYTDIPGDNKFVLENSFELNAEGVGGKLFSGKEYNFYFSSTKLDKGWLEGNLKEADCQKVSTGSPKSGRLEVKLKGRVVKGKLGTKHKNEVKAGEVLKIWQPNARAGHMTLKATAGAELQVFHPDLKTPYKAKARDAKAQPTGAAQVVKGSGEVSFDVAKNNHKWFYIKVSKPCDVTSSFYTEAIPRDKDGTPMFPWHFFYWPVNKTTSWKENNSVFAKFGRAFLPSGQEKYAQWWEAGGLDAVADGKSKGHAEVVKKAADKVYEEKDRGHNRPSQPGWAGHCHNSAPSSMLFAECKAAAHGGENFTVADLQLLMAEVTGNYGQFKGGGWGLPALNVYVTIVYVFGNPDPNTGAMPAPVKKPRRVNLMTLLKPAETDPAAALKKAFYDKYHRDMMYSGKKFIQMTDAQCQEAVDEIIKGYGDKAAFNKAVIAKWGQAGPSFVDNIYRMMADDGDPCMGDIRANQSADGPSAIWNNCAMYVRSEFEQRDDAKDEKDVLANHRFYFNIDNANVLGYTTCEITAKGEIEPKNFWGRTMLLEQRFDDAGRPESGKNKLTSFTAQGNSWREGEVYMVTYLSRVSGMASARKKADGTDDFGMGNYYVTHDFVKSGVVSLRAKYA